MQWIIALLPTTIVALALFAAEYRHGQRGTDWWRNLETFAIQRVLAIVLLPLFPFWSRYSLLDGAKLPLWLGFAIFLVVRDCGEYFFHRAQHSVPFLWAMHSLHHSDPDMNVFTTQRHFWGDQFIKQITIWPATVAVIAPTPAIVFWFGVASLWNLFLHSGLPIDFGRFSWVINSPEYHRRHHSIEPEHYNSNFAALLPIFDVLTGAYFRAEGHPRTGMPRKPENLWELLIWPLIWDKPKAAPATMPA